MPRADPPDGHPIGQPPRPGRRAWCLFSVHARRRPSRDRPGSVRLNPSCPNDALQTSHRPNTRSKQAPRTPPGPTAPPWTRWANGPSRPVTRRQRGRGIRCSARTTGDRVPRFQGRSSTDDETCGPASPIMLASSVCSPIGRGIRRCEPQIRDSSDAGATEGIACRKNVGRTLAACTPEPMAGAGRARDH